MSGEPRSCARPAERRPAAASAEARSPCARARAAGTDGRPSGRAFSGRGTGRAARRKGRRSPARGRDGVGGDEPRTPARRKVNRVRDSACRRATGRLRVRHACASRRVAGEGPGAVSRREVPGGNRVGLLAAARRPDEARPVQDDALAFWLREPGAARSGRPRCPSRGRTMSWCVPCASGVSRGTETLVFRGGVRRASTPRCGRRSRRGTSRGR